MSLSALEMIQQGKLPAFRAKDASEAANASLQWGLKVSLGGGIWCKAEVVGDGFYARIFHETGGFANGEDTFMVVKRTKLQGIEWLWSKVSTGR